MNLSVSDNLKIIHHLRPNLTYSFVILLVLIICLLFLLKFGYIQVSMTESWASQFIMFIDVIDFLFPVPVN